MDKKAQREKAIEVSARSIALLQEQRYNDDGTKKGTTRGRRRRIPMWTRSEARTLWTRSEARTLSEPPVCPRFKRAVE